MFGLWARASRCHVLRKFPCTPFLISISKWSSAFASSHRKRIIVGMRCNWSMTKTINYDFQGLHFFTGYCKQRAHIATHNYVRDHVVCEYMLDPLPSLKARWCTKNLRQSGWCAQALWLLQTQACSCSCSWYLNYLTSPRPRQPLSSKGAALPLPAVVDHSSAEKFSMYVHMSAASGLSL